MHTSWTGPDMPTNAFSTSSPSGVPVRGTLMLSLTSVAISVDSSADSGGGWNGFARAPQTCLCSGQICAQWEPNEPRANARQRVKESGRASFWCCAPQKRISSPALRQPGHASLVFVAQTLHGWSRRNSMVVQRKRRDLCETAWQGRRYDSVGACATDEGFAKYV